MVKGISRQVIVVHSPDPKLFDQAIFILKDSAALSGVSDEALLKEAQQAIHFGSHRKHKIFHYGAFWALVGAGFTALLWLLTVIF